MDNLPIWEILIFIFVGLIYPQVREINIRLETLVELQKEILNKLKYSRE